MNNTSPPRRYDSVARGLHWAMAILFAWQFCTTGARLFLKDMPVEQFLWSTHKPLGTLLMVLIVVRIIWALCQRRTRPASVSLAAKLGHAWLYAAMVVIPLVALLRQYGSGREFSVAGVTLMPGFDEPKIEWMIALGSNLHGLVGWLLLASIVGHIGMVLMHRKAGKQEVIASMYGKSVRRSVLENKAHV